MKPAKMYFVLALFGLLFMMTPTAQAHHSVTSEFDIRKLLPMEGTVVKIEMINPHPWLEVDVKAPDGSTERWQFEFVSSWGSHLAEGQACKFVVAPERTGTKKRAYIVEVTLPDGRKLSRAQ